MNDILGILIPLLMSGADLGTILRSLGGAGSGAVGMDGLQAILQESAANARFAHQGAPNEKTVNGASELLLDRLGINPFSGLGQGLSAGIGALYQYMPDTMGAVLGLPNGGKFFSTLANGASGINQAAGFGTTDIFNPYSVLSAQEHTMKMARTIYGDLVVNPGGKGYNVDYGHGLNMDELGKVTQRLLTSDIPYRSQETGDRLNPEDEEDAKEFKQNLKKLGSKFNEAASMLAKVTGSVDEALSVMDRLAGGNFLGGTAEQATAVANKARKMATAIRVTSSIAGINPQEMYANMQGLQQSMAVGMGMNPYFAQASGFTSLLTDMAFNGTAAYTAWAAMNPDASPQQRQQALFAANGRAQAYANSNGAALAAAVADNAKLFTPEELTRFQESYRAGRPNEMVGLIRARLGTNMYTEYMTDPAMQIAARKRAMEENPDVLNGIDQAGIEGNLAQAENFGSSRIIKKTLSDMETTVTRVTGKSGFSKEIEDAGKESLRKLARTQGLTEERVEQMGADDLRSFLKARPNANAGEIERTENVAKISAARARINELTMTSEDEKAARATLREEIGRSTNWSADERAKLTQRLDAGDKLTDVYRDFAGALKGAQARELRTQVFGGKMTQDEAAREQARLDRLELTQRTDFTALERMDAIENDFKRQNLKKIGALKNQISAGIKSGLSDREAMSQFAERANELAESGDIDLSEDDAKLSKTFGAATQDVVSEIFGSSLGEMKGEALETFKKDFSEQMEEARKGGSSLREAFQSAVAWAKKNRSQELGGAEGSGFKALEDWATKASDPNSYFSQKRLSQETYLSAATSRLEDMTKGRKASAMAEMRRLASGDFKTISDREAMSQFAEQASVARVFTGDWRDLDQMKVNGIAQILSDKNLKLDAKTRKELAEKANQEVEEGDGKVGYGAAIASVLRDYAKTDGRSDEERKRLNAGAEQIGADKDVGKTVIGNVLGQMHKAGQRILPFEAVSAAGDVNQALTVIAAVGARMTGLDMSKLGLGENWSDLVSHADDIKSGATMNAIPNALGVGDASFRREAVRDTENRIAALRDRLNGEFDEKQIRTALVGTDEDAKKQNAAIRAKLSDGNRSESEVRSDMALLESLRENRIGGKSGLDVMLSKDALSEMRKEQKDGKKGQLDEDLIGVTKEANQKDSDAFGFIKSIADLAKKMEPFFSDPKQVFNVNVVRGISAQ